MEKIKIRIKETGKIDYCYDEIVRDGFIEKNGHKIPKFVHTYYTDETKTAWWEPDKIDIIPWEPFELFGIECGKGWHELLKPIFAYIEEYNKNKTEEERLVPCQIKEKFAELRVYMNFYTPELEKLIEEAEKEAENTCELCGSKKDVGMACEGWLTVECHDCMKKWCKENERPHRWRRNEDKKIYWVNPDREDELFEGKLP